LKTFSSRNETKMTTLTHITISEFQALIKRSQLSSETRVSITFEDDHTVLELIKRKKIYEAMRKLRGSGNGNLVNVLLQEREGDNDL
jgi:hypothetical protein